MLTMEQTKKLINFAKLQDSGPSIENYFKLTLNINGNVAGIYAESLEAYPKLLDSLKKEEVEKVLGFISKRFISNSPLKNKLTIDQKQKMQLADFAENIGFMGFEEEMQEKVADLLAIHPDWDEKDAVAHLHNRAARYTPEYEWLDYRYEQLKGKKMSTSTLEQILSKEESAQPPKKWFKEMQKEVKQNNPDYTAEQVRKTVGDIWYHKLSEKKKKEIREREGKKYKAASSYPTLAKILGK